MCILVVRSPDQFPSNSFLSFGSHSKFSVQKVVRGEKLKMPDTSVPKKVGGKARKSTQKAKKSVKEKAVLRERNSSLSSSFVSTKKKKGSEVQQIDPNVS